MKNIQNKWIRGAIPALLLHCSIGTVYCWSIFSQEIANYIGFSKGAVEWAFSFAIFFLGMSAAFLGGLVEKNIHKSSLIASITKARLDFRLFKKTCSFGVNGVLKLFISFLLSLYQIFHNLLSL